MSRRQMRSGAMRVREGAGACQAGRGEGGRAEGERERARMRSRSSSGKSESERQGEGEGEGEEEEEVMVVVGVEWEMVRMVGVVVERVQEAEIPQTLGICAQSPITVNGDPDPAQWRAENRPPRTVIQNHNWLLRVLFLRLPHLF